MPIMPILGVSKTSIAGGLSQRILKEPKNKQNPCQHTLLYHDHTPSFPAN